MLIAARIATSGFLVEKCLARMHTPNHVLDRSVTLSFPRMLLARAPAVGFAHAPANSAGVEKIRYGDGASRVGPNFGVRAMDSTLEEHKREIE